MIYVNKRKTVLTVLENVHYYLNNKHYFVMSLMQTSLGRTFLLLLLIFLVLFVYLIKFYLFLNHLK